MVYYWKILNRGRSDQPSPGFLLRVPKFEDRPLPKQCHKKTLYSFDLIDKYVVKPSLKLTAGPGPRV